MDGPPSAIEVRALPTRRAEVEATAREILRRLEAQPGLILADEVGMGKTFVALAVAASVALHRKHPVVVMVPPALKEKWPRDLTVFTEKCLEPDLHAKLSYGFAERATQFFKLLDVLLLCFFLWFSDLLVVHFGKRIFHHSF